MIFQDCIHIRQQPELTCVLRYFRFKAVQECLCRAGAEIKQLNLFVLYPDNTFTAQQHACADFIRFFTAENLPIYQRFLDYVISSQAVSQIFLMGLFIQRIVFLHLVNNNNIIHISPVIYWIPSLYNCVIKGGQNPIRKDTGGGKSNWKNIALANTQRRFAPNDCPQHVRIPAYRLKNEAVYSIVPRHSVLYSIKKQLKMCFLQMYAVIKALEVQRQDDRILFIIQSLLRLFQTVIPPALILREIRLKQSG